MKLESIVQYVGEYLGVEGHPDYDRALNGLQVDGPVEVGRIAAAVDASEASIAGAADLGADLLLVHHGLFWGGLRSVTGPRYRKLRRLVEASMALYSVHLPLDGHPEVGNCALLARAMGMDPEGRFGAYKGVPLGWWGRLDEDRTSFVGRVEHAVDGPVRLIPGGPDRVGRVGVVTGSAADLVEEAAAAGLDTFVTGEGAHHTYLDAMELGVNVLFAGHYATETFGVRALAAHLAERFDLTWDFVDNPTGL